MACLTPCRAACLYAWGEGDDLALKTRATGVAKTAAAVADAPAIDRSGPAGVVIARVHKVHANGRITIALPDGQKLMARSLVRFSPDDRGRAVAMLFEAGEPQRPMVLGPVIAGLPDETAPPPPVRPRSELPAGVSVTRDGKRLIISAEEEVILRCGESSVTLTAAGKVLIGGKYVSSRSTGVNRIRGASIQLN